jgi:hypothetical protein
VKTKQDALRYMTALMDYAGLTSFGLDSFSLELPGEMVARMTKEKVCRFTGIATDAKGKRRKVKVQVTSETGMLLFWYIGWPK